MGPSEDFDGRHVLAVSLELDGTHSHSVSKLILSSKILIGHVIRLRLHRHSDSENSRGLRFIAKI